MREETGSWRWKREGIPELSTSLPVLVEHSNAPLLQATPPTHYRTVCVVGGLAPGSLGH